MARDYGKLTHGFWTGETGREMRGFSGNVRLVAAYLCSCGSANMTGIYYLPLELMVHEIGAGLTIEGASEALRTLAELDFAHYDSEREMVWVPNLAREQVAQTLKAGDKQRDGILAQLAKMLKCPFIRDFYRRYRSAYCLPDPPEDASDARVIEAPPKALQRPLEARAQRSEIRAQEGGDPSPTRSARARLFDGGVTGHSLVTLFGIMRSEVFPGTLAWSTARDAKGDAHQFAAMLGQQEIQDIEPTMRLALEHIRDGAEGWKHPRMKDPSFAFGAWKAGFHGLREELAKRAPKIASPSAAAGRALREEQRKREEREASVPSWTTEQIAEAEAMRAGLLDHVTQKEDHHVDE
jgi:hypothetical protein